MSAAEGTVLPSRRAGLVTLQGHLLSQQDDYPEASGTLSWILSASRLCAWLSVGQVRRGRLGDVLGTIGGENAGGERQQKLVVIAHAILLRTPGVRGGVAFVA